jgi:DNA-binding transcriptional regulator YhcF (GntR family)
MIPTENWRVDLDNRTPIYQQIIANFSRALVRGDLKPGDRILSIRELSAALKVNTNTTQRAYQEMERDGLIYSQRGTGYFIMENMELTAKVKQTMTARTLTLFLEEMRALGFEDGDILTELENAIKGGNR